MAIYYFAATILFPIVALILLYRNRNDLLSNENRDKFGTLYEGVNESNRKALILTAFNFC